jgi:hypothetical protein
MNRERRSYVLTLHGELRKLRPALKILRRWYGLRCVSAYETIPTIQTSHAADHRHRRHASIFGGGLQRRRQMSIGKRKTGGASILPRLKIDGRTAGIYQEDRVKGSQGWESEQQSIPYGKFRATMDLTNLERGYADFSGRVPDLQFKPLGEDIGDPPSENHKEGIRVLMQMDASLGGAVRELISTAIAVYDSFDALHDKYEAGLADHRGELPVVECSGVTESKIGKGTSAAPVWRIVEWVPRPPELPVAGIPLPKRTVKTADAEEDESDDGAEMIEAIATLAAKKQSDDERVEAIAAQKDRSGGGGYADMDDEIPF